MQISQLPPEIIDKILIAAVQARGIQRASRLRYVCKSWADAVLHAIFASGILEDERLLQLNSQNFYRSRYLAHEVLGTRRSRGLQIVRRVAERIVAHRCPLDDNGNEHFELVRECVQQLCEMPLIATNKACSREPLQWLAKDPAEGVSDDDMQFQQALLTAAAWMNETSLVKHLLPRFQDHPYIVSWDGRGGSYKFELICGTPVPMAAMQGNLKLLKALLQVQEQGSHPHHQVGDILLFGAKGNKLSVVDYALGLNDKSSGAMAAKAAEATTNLEIFQRLLPLAKHDFETSRRHDRETYAKKWLPSVLVYAARAGSLDIVRYLVETLGVFPTAQWIAVVRHRRDPVLGASLHGHKDVLLYLLGKGFSLHQQSFVAAIRYGELELSQEVIRIALEDKEHEYDFGQAFLEAVAKENEAVVKVMLVMGSARLSADDRSWALQFSHDLRLETMTRLLKPLI